MPAPTSAQLQAVAQQIAERVGRLLEKRGLVERDMENAWLTTDGSSGPLDDLIGHSITYRIAVGPRAGQALFTLQTLPSSATPEAEQQGDHRGAAQAGGFSLHAGIDIEPHQRPKLERLCRYVSRPPVAVDRMAFTASGQVRYTLAASAHPCARGISDCLHVKDAVSGRHHAQGRMRPTSGPRKDFWPLGLPAPSSGAPQRLLGEVDCAPGVVEFPIRIRLRVTCATALA